MIILIDYIGMMFTLHPVKFRSELLDTVRSMFVLIQMPLITILPLFFLFTVIVIILLKALHNKISLSSWLYKLHGLYIFLLLGVAIFWILPAIGLL